LDEGNQTKGYRKQTLSSRKIDEITGGKVLGWLALQRQQPQNTKENGTGVHKKTNNF
jgi:hypothetical protein